MNRNFRIISFCILAAVTFTSTALAQDAPGLHEAELLWPNGAPGAKGSEDGDKPTLTIYLPPKEKANGTAVVICPGGGYGHLAMDHEGHQVAQWLNSLGVAGFILKYRHRNSGAGYGHPAPLQDAQRAVRMVRGRAKEWSIDPNRIGILGFSAGGHLASSAGTHFQQRYSDIEDEIDSSSCRPDFMILIYPVITLAKPYTHGGSRFNLLGNNPDMELIENLSNDKQITPETPPTFLVHSNDDKAVPPENSVNFYLALRKAGVPAEMHIYQNGGHGYGLGKPNTAESSWPASCADWLKGRGILDKKNSELMLN
ncbi:MAG: alpha/beta hydrolase [Phycisphaerales bacterium]|jgi:acetyl esterase/lipase